MDCRLNGRETNVCKEAKSFFEMPKNSKSSLSKKP